jgi:acetyl esterase
MKDLPAGAPIVIDIHGGGWRATLDIDDFRNRHIASHLECVLVSIEYGEKSLEDCLAAFMWIYDHAAELGGDKDRIGLHGTSFGGKLAAGLSLWFRDKGGPGIALTVLNCPMLDIRPSVSRTQFSDGPTIKGSSLSSTARELISDISVTSPSYYQLPMFCPDLSGLPPTVVIAAEYDPLRDEAIEYAFRLLKAGVPCELYSLPRVVHGYAVLGAPLTDWMHEGVCASFRREFGMTRST